MSSRIRRWKDYVSLFLEDIEDCGWRQSMLTFNPLWWHKPAVIVSYGVAVLSVIAALIILWWMETVFHSAPHVSLLLCAIMFTAWFGGVRPGLLAISLSVLAFKYYFLPPTHS